MSNLPPNYNENTNLFHYVNSNDGLYSNNLVDDELSDSSFGSSSNSNTGVFPNHNTNQTLSHNPYYIPNERDVSSGAFIPHKQYRNQATVSSGHFQNPHGNYINSHGTFNTNHVCSSNLNGRNCQCSSNDSSGINTTNCINSVNSNDSFNYISSLNNNNSLNDTSIQYGYSSPVYHRIQNDSQEFDRAEETLQLNSQNRSSALCHNSFQHNPDYFHWEEYSLAHDQKQMEEDYKIALELQQQELELQQQELEQKQFAHQPEEVTMTCDSCKGSITIENIEFCDCQHSYCKACLRDLVFTFYKNRQTEMKCKVCQSNLSQANIKSILTKDEYEKYLNFTFSQHLESNPNYTTCPKCDHVFERVFQPRHVLEARLKEQGLQISEKHIHKEQNRFRCRQCEIDFCAKCKQSPYHDNFTCSQFEKYKESKKCRFCSEAITSTKNHCDKEECIERSNLVCSKVLECNHPCGGIRGEKNCLPCLICNSEGQSGDEYCNICWTEPLAAAPCIKLECSHIFHYECLTKKIKKGWTGARITFGFLNCPLCQTLVSHKALEDIMKPYLSLKSKVEAKCMKRMEYLNLMKCDAITTVSSKFYKKPLEYAIYNFAYYPCYECKEPYFGGMRQCDQNAGDGNNEFDPSHLICSQCSIKKTGSKATCEKHGSEYMMYKCRFCCSPSTWFCWGTTRFCDSCHSLQVAQQRLANTNKNNLPKCLGPGKCPIGGKHAPNGEECCIGCMLCIEMMKDF